MLVFINDVFLLLSTTNLRIITILLILTLDGDITALEKFQIFMM